MYKYNGYCMIVKKDSTTFIGEIVGIGITFNCDTEEECVDLFHQYIDSHPFEPD